MTALVASPAIDAVARDHPVLPLLALVCVIANTSAAVLANTFAPRSQPWLVPLSLTVLGFLSVATTVAYGQPWWNVWILFAAAIGGVWQDRGGVLVVLAVPVSAALTLRGTGATGSEVQVLAVTVFLAGVANHVLVRLLTTVRELRLAQRELARRAVDEERERFSRDLHDLLGHTLSLVVVKAEAVRRLSQRDPEAAMRHTLDIESIGRQALVEVREAVDGYRRTSLAGEVARARLVLEAAGVAADLEVASTPLPQDVDEAFAWVVREGVTNVVRHAGARTCRLRVELRAATAWLELTDDGRGLGEESAHPGAGLTGLRQRLTAVGGELVATRSEEGFLLAATALVTGGEDGALPRSSAAERG
jgi:two-component system, NarL family, sensor histidine kinase DesK